MYFIEKSYTVVFICVDKDTLFLVCVLCFIKVLDKLGGRTTVDMTRLAVAEIMRSQLSRGLFKAYADMIQGHTVD